MERAGSTAGIDFAAARIEFVARGQLCYRSAALWSRVLSPSERQLTADNHQSPGSQTPVTPLRRAWPGSD
jgi:hypothetical protein